MKHAIRVRLGERSYTIIVTDQGYGTFGKELKRLGLGRRALVTTNNAVYQKHGRDLRASLKRVGIQAIWEKQFPTDERAKSLDWFLPLIKKMIRTDPDFVICFSGGVLGDLTGFVAATYKRGIPYIQVPTTLLSQVDSAIGGKTGIDLPTAKNYLGAFYQPRLVYSDMSVLKKLPEENLRDGLAEAIKYGVIQSEPFFSFIEKNIDRLLKKDGRALQQLVATCSRIKARVVEQDEYDRKGIRRVLNFGHTLGHALEQVAGYRTRHGRAISVGMLLAAEIAAKEGLLQRKELDRLETLLKKVGLPTTLMKLQKRRWRLDQILKAEGRDKKFAGGIRQYVLPTRIGRVVIRKGIREKVIREVILKRMK